MNIPDALAKGALSVTCTGLLALGAAVIGAARTDAVQDVDIKAVQDKQANTDATLKQLDEAVRSLDKNVAVLNERLNDKPKNH